MKHSFKGTIFVALVLLFAISSSTLILEDVPELNLDLIANQEEQEISRESRYLKPQPAIGMPELASAPLNIQTDSLAESINQLDSAVDAKKEGLAESVNEPRNLELKNGDHAEQNQESANQSTERQLGGLELPLINLLAGLGDSQPITIQRLRQQKTRLHHRKRTTRISRRTPRIINPFKNLLENISSDIPELPDPRPTFDVLAKRPSLRYVEPEIQPRPLLRRQRLRYINPSNRRIVGQRLKVVNPLTVRGIKTGSASPLAALLNKLLPNKNTLSIQRQKRLSHNQRFRYNRFAQNGNRHEAQSLSHESNLGVNHDSHEIISQAPSLGGNGSPDGMVQDLMKQLFGGAVPSSPFEARDIDERDDTASDPLSALLGPLAGSLGISEPKSSGDDDEISGLFGLLGKLDKQKKEIKDKNVDASTPAYIKQLLNPSTLRPQFNKIAVPKEEKEPNILDLLTGGSQNDGGLGLLSGLLKGGKGQLNEEPDLLKLLGGADSKDGSSDPLGQLVGMGDKGSGEDDLFSLFAGKDKADEKEPDLMGLLAGLNGNTDKADSTMGLGGLFSMLGGGSDKGDGGLLGMLGGGSDKGNPLSALLGGGSDKSDPLASLFGGLAGNSNNSKEQQPDEDDNGLSEILRNISPTPEDIEQPVQINIGSQRLPKLDIDSTPSNLSRLFGSFGTGSHRKLNSSPLNLAALFNSSPAEPIAPTKATQNKIQVEDTLAKSPKAPLANSLAKMLSQLLNPQSDGKLVKI